MLFALLCPAGHRWEVTDPPACPVCGQPGSAHPADPPAETTAHAPASPGGASTVSHPPGTGVSPGLTTFAAGLERLAHESLPPAGVTVASHRPPVVGVSPPDAPGFEGYVVLDRIGRGGMGVVYLAVQEGLNRVVAIKTVLIDAREEVLQRFQKEAEAVARLRHENIVQIHHVGTAERDGARAPYMVLEYLEGGGLDKQIAGTPWPGRRAAGLVETLARAVGCAHRAGVIHRDLKPSNVLLTGDGVPKVSDFGLAKRVDEDSGQTKTGSVLGTPSYMAPEQARGEVRQVGPRTDVYALGAILYELLTGRPPFKGPTEWETVTQVVRDAPAAPRLLNPAVPADLETVCLKCLAKEPEKRYASADDLADDLRHYLKGEPIRAKPPGFGVRFRLWCRRPERVYDAGAFMVFFGIVCILWCLSGLVFLATGSLTPTEPGAAAGQLVRNIAVFYAPLIWIGLGTMARRRLWLWVGAVVAAADLLTAALCVIGSNPAARFCDLGGLFADANGRIPVFSLLGLIMGTQFFLYCVALYAYYSNPDAAR